MIISLPLLKAGTYVVVWRTQSADDGHITGGSFIFRIAAPNGDVPPIPSVLPTGNIPGGGGITDASSSGLDAPSIAQAIFTWLALLGMAVWVGGVIWETWILPSGLTRDGALREAALAAERRFRRLAHRADRGAGGGYRHDSGAISRVGRGLHGRNLAAIAPGGAFWQPLRRILVDARTGGAGRAHRDPAGDPRKSRAWPPAVIRCQQRR